MEGGFGSSKIFLGEIEVSQISKFERIWSYGRFNERKTDSSVTFYKPACVPEGYCILGHCCNSSNANAHPSWTIVVKDRKNSSISLTRTLSTGNEANCYKLPPLLRPIGYSLVWKSHEENKDNGVGYIWLPKSPQGYKACGFIVTRTPSQPSLEQVRCVRSDLTEIGEAKQLIFSTNTWNNPFSIWDIRPKVKGARALGVSVGTFYFNKGLKHENLLPLSCLKNCSHDLLAMPNLFQMRSIIQKYGPVMFFHPNETLFPSSVTWLFESGQLLYKKGSEMPLKIANDGSNLPQGGTNDKEYWLDFPKEDEAAKRIKRGDLESALAYVHFKPSFGGTFTDIAMWLFFPFNGPVTVKIGPVNITLKYGEHAGNWEHFTLRVSNFTGDLWQAYFSQHMRGQWVDVSELERVQGNRVVVYAAKSCHAMFPHPGNHLDGDRKLGIGLRNDASKSMFYLDTSKKYQIVSADHLQLMGSNESIVEPPWLQYMRQWGQNLPYSSRSEIDKVIRLLPSKLSLPLESLLHNLPKELSGEQGPTGPKAKDNWYGDERS